MPNNYLSTAVLIIFYAILRLFSFFYGPKTPQKTQSPINTAIALIITALTVYLILKKDERGWYLIAGEIILGGAGGFLSVGPIALRSVLLIISSIIFYSQLIIKNEIKNVFNENKKTILILVLILATAGLAAIRGIAKGHGAGPVIADFIPYLFLFYFLPLITLLKSKNFQQFAVLSLTTAVVCNLIFVIITAAGFSSGIFALQGAYYHWFRDVALGKITETDSGFFRVVLNEHLLIVPLFLIFLKKFFVSSQRKYLCLALILLPILAVNITRIYLLALLIGILFLFRKNNYKQWLIWSTASLFIFLLSFSAIHLTLSREHTLGLDLLGLRLQSVARPFTEDSALSRLILLPKILDKIQKNPIQGAGLGDTIEVYSPVLKQTITTFNFDWGYLEIMAEMGLTGALAWVLLIIFAFQITRQNYDLAPLAALLIMNITSPAFFHVMGVLLIIYLLAVNRVSPKLSL